MLTICAAITPFTANGDLDAEGLRPLFAAIKDSGVDHVFAAGSTGEFTALDDDERIAVISAALDVFGTDGVFAHVGAATARQAVRLARAAAELGARHLAAITPYYLAAGPEGTVAYFRALAEAVPDARVFPYVFPQRATTDVDPETLSRIAAIPGLAGVKMSGRSPEELKPYLEAVPDDFIVFSGNDRDTIALAAAGCDGVVSGVCSVFAEPIVAAVTAINNGEDPTAYQSAIDRAIDAVGGGDIALLKAGAALRGRPAGPARVATEPPSPAALERLRAAVAAA
jgi:4-hydroxy-tetrahydrodipicolinate synthase